MNTFYLTTPIYYVNDKPHIGHAYTTILADVLTRFHRNEGEDVFFLTGLDEHGQKVQQAAEKRKVAPKDHCDEMAPRFIELWDKLHIKNDDFIRTTEKRHVTVVQKILQEVFDNGDIYEDEYEGLYSVSEERFITEKEAESGAFRDIKELKEKFDLKRQPMAKRDPKEIKFLLQDVIITYRTVENACSPEFIEHAQPLIDEMVDHFLEGLFDPALIRELFFKVRKNELVRGFEGALHGPYSEAGLNIRRVEDWPVEKINWVPEELKKKLIPPIQNLFASFKTHLG